MTAPMPSLADAWRFLDDSDLVANATEIEAAMTRVAAGIHGALSQAYPVVLVVMGGAVVFAGRLLPLLRFPLDLDYLHVSRYGAGTQGGRRLDRRGRPRGHAKRDGKRRGGQHRVDLPEAEPRARGENPGPSFVGSRQ